MSCSQAHQEVVSTDYELSAVPAHARRSFASITLVWTGFVFLITSMIAGGGIAQGLDFWSVITAIMLGNLFLCIIALAIALIAYKTGLSFALITRYAFGYQGSRLASLFVPIVNIGWYTVQSAVYGHFLALMCGVEGTWIELLIMCVAALVMGLFALVGMNALTLLGYVAIPAITFLCIATALKAGQGRTAAEIVGYVATQPAPFTSGLTVVIGTWILSVATCIADIMRYAKTLKQALFSTFIGLFCGNSLLMICGALAFIGTGNADLPQVLLDLGLVVPAFILMSTNLFTTNGSNLYSTSLNLANAFSWSRRKLSVAILVVSALLTMLKPNDVSSLMTFLFTLGNIVPPLAGILIADFYILHKGSYPPLEEASKKAWDISPWIAWGASVALVYLIMYLSSTAGIALGQSSLNGMILGLVLYPICSKLFGARVRSDHR